MTTLDDPTTTLRDFAYKGLTLRLVARRAERVGYEVRARETLLLVSPSSYSTPERAEDAARTFVDEVDRRMGLESLGSLAVG